MSGRVVVGIGNPWRGDDAAGLAVAARLRGRLPADVELVEIEDEPTRLLDSMEHAHALFVADAVAPSGAAPGTVHRIDAVTSPLPQRLFSGSTHHLGLADTVELARSLGRLPERVVVFGIEAERFAAGEPLAPAVDRAAHAVADQILAELEGGSDA